MGMNTHFVSLASPCLFQQLKAQLPITILQQGNLQADSSRLLSESRSHKMAWKRGCQFLHSITQRRETCPGPIPLVVSTCLKFEPFPSNPANLIDLLATSITCWSPFFWSFMAFQQSSNCSWHLPADIPRLQPLQECFQILGPNMSLQLVSSNILTSSSKGMEKHERWATSLWLSLSHQSHLWICCYILFTHMSAPPKALTSVRSSNLQSATWQYISMHSWSAARLCNLRLQELKAHEPGKVYKFIVQYLEPLNWFCK